MAVVSASLNRPESPAPRVFRAALPRIWASIFDGSVTIGPEITLPKNDIATADRNPYNLAFKFSPQIGADDAATREVLSRKENKDHRSVQPTSSKGDETEDVIAPLTGSADSVIPPRWWPSTVRRRANTSPNCNGWRWRRASRLEHAADCPNNSEDLDAGEVCRRISDS